MLNIIRTVVVAVLLLPVLVLGVLSQQDRVLPVELVVVSLIASALSITLWLVLTARQARLQSMAHQILEALAQKKESQEKLIDPLLQNPVRFDAVYDALLQLSKTVVERRQQLRLNLDKVSGIMITLSQGRPLEIGADHFDLPDHDDKTLLLGSMCQMISTLQQTRQRGDVFANELRDSPIAMLITDPALKIRSLNPAAEKLFGYSQQQLIKHSLAEFFIPPPIQSHQSHLKSIVLPGEEAIKALQEGRQEVFTTIRNGHGKTQLIGLRASFGQHCLFVIRERSKDHFHADINGSDTLHMTGSNHTVPMPVSAAS